MVSPIMALKSMGVRTYCQAGIAGVVNDALDKGVQLVDALFD